MGKIPNFEIWRKSSRFSKLRRFWTWKWGILFTCGMLWKLEQCFAFGGPKLNSELSIIRYGRHCGISETVVIAETFAVITNMHYARRAHIVDRIHCIQSELSPLSALWNMSGFESGHSSFFVQLTVTVIRKRCGSNVLGDRACLPR